MDTEKFCTQGIPQGNPHITQGIIVTSLMSFLYLYSQWTRWDARYYWPTPHNRTEWHINTFCCSEPHSFVQCKVRKSSFSGVGYGNFGLNKTASYCNLHECLVPKFEIVNSVKFDLNFSGMPFIFLRDHCSTISFLNFPFLRVLLLSNHNLQYLTQKCL